MLSFLKHIAQTKEKRIVTFELNFSPDGISGKATAIEFHRKKKGIEFSVVGDVLTDPGEWKNIINKEIALALVITGKGVITKRIEKGESYQFHIRNVLPNANPDDFYWQIIDCRDHQMVSVVRKTQVLEYLEKVTAANYLIGEIYLGTANAYPLAAIAGMKEIITSGQKTELIDGEPASVSVTTEISEPIILDGKTIKADHITAIGAGFSYYLGIQGAENIDLSKEELGYRNLLHKIGLGSLAILLLIIGFNFYFKNYYQERFLLLSEIMTSTAGERQEMAGIQLELNEKRALIQSTGLSMHHWLSFYADNIGESVPKQIILMDLSICPLSGKRMEPGESAEFKADQILITGTTPGSEVLHAWVEELKSREWTREVIVEFFKQKEEQNLSQFTIQITLA